MKKIAFISLLILSAMTSLKAQSNVVINEDAEVSRMMARMVENNRFAESIDGWRIQILATTDRRKMEDARQKFLADFPGIKVDWKHEKPYYKLRVGAFATKLEASRLLYQLKSAYPSAYPAKDLIQPSELVGL